MLKYMVFKLILNDGEYIGNYSDKKSPAQVARSAMRTIFKKTDRREADINFFNTHTKKEYTYRSSIIDLETPEIITFGGKKFTKMYKIETKRI